MQGNYMANQMAREYGNITRYKNSKFLPICTKTTNART